MKRSDDYYLSKEIVYYTHKIMQYTKEGLRDGKGNTDERTGF
ncbi:hypothetical protein [Clostridium thermosuccinogenes]|nr:hypothetical protein [Pseudoclostridium thermosuccinogenes]